MKKFTCIILMLLLWLPGCSGDQPGSGSELLITDVILIDGTGSDPQVGVDIRIADGRIVEIGPGLSAASDSETIDGNGKYVIPGLIDAHVHMDAPMVFQLTPEEKARIIDKFLADKLETETPNLRLAFDIPLRHIDKNEELRRELGLER